MFSYTIKPLFFSWKNFKLHGLTLDSDVMFHLQRHKFDLESSWLEICLISKIKSLFCSTPHSAFSFLCWQMNHLFATDISIESWVRAPRDRTSQANCSQVKALWCIMSEKWLIFILIKNQFMNLSLPSSSTIKHLFFSKKNRLHR